MLWKVIGDHLPCDILADLPQLRRIRNAFGNYRLLAFRLRPVCLMPGLQGSIDFLNRLFQFHCHFLLEAFDALLEVLKIQYLSSPHCAREFLNQCLALLALLPFLHAFSTHRQLL